MDRVRIDSKQTSWRVNVQLYGSSASQPNRNFLQRCRVRHVPLSRRSMNQWLSYLQRRLDCTDRASLEVSRVSSSPQVCAIVRKLETSSVALRLRALTFSVAAQFNRPVRTTHYSLLLYTLFTSTAVRHQTGNKKPRHIAKCKNMVHFSCLCFCLLTLLDILSLLQ